MKAILLAPLLVQFWKLSNCNSRWARHYYPCQCTHLTAFTDSYKTDVKFSINWKHASQDQFLILFINSYRHFNVSENSDSRGQQEGRWLDKTSCENISKNWKKKKNSEKIISNMRVVFAVSLQGNFIHFFYHLSIWGFVHFHIYLTCPDHLSIYWTLMSQNWCNVTDEQLNQIL